MSCHKEHHYSDKKEAIRVMRRMQRNIRNGPLPVRVYFCPEHKGWEVTSKPKRNDNGR